MTDTSTAPQSEKESGRHPVNVGHLVMGTALLGLVAVWALIVGDVVDGEDVRWLLPVPWVLAGAAGLIALATTGHRGRETRQVGWVTSPEAPEDTGDTEQADPMAEPTTDSPTEETR